MWWMPVPEVPEPGGLDRPNPKLLRAPAGLTGPPNPRPCVCPVSGSVQLVRLQQPCREQESTWSVWQDAELRLEPRHAADPLCPRLQCGSPAPTISKVTAGSQCSQCTPRPPLPSPAQLPTIFTSASAPSTSYNNRSSRLPPAFPSHPVALHPPSP